MPQQKSAAELEKEKEPVILKNEPFTLAQVEVFWKQFASKMKEEGRRTEFIILDRPFILEGETIKLRLDNLVQEDLLNSFRPDLLRFLRQSVNNSSLALDADIVPQEEVKLRYTSNDKFKYLAEKFPVLDEMKKKFGLDTDF